MNDLRNREEELEAVAFPVVAFLVVVAARNSFVAAVAAAASWAEIAAGSDCTSVVDFGPRDNREEERRCRSSLLAAEDQLADKSQQSILLQMTRK